MIAIKTLHSFINRLLASSTKSHFQNEAKCKTFLVKMSYICMTINKPFSPQWKETDTCGNSEMFLALMHVFVMIRGANFTTVWDFEVAKSVCINEFPIQGSRVEKNTLAQRVKVRRIMLTNEWWNFLFWRDHCRRALLTGWSDLIWFSFVLYFIFWQLNDYLSFFSIHLESF